MSVRKRLMIATGVALGLYGLFCGLIWFKTGFGPVSTTHQMACAIRERARWPCSVIDDLDRMCAVMAEGNARQFTDEQQKSRWLTERMIGGFRTKEGLEIFKAVGLAPTDRKLGLVLEAAARNGAPSWDCPAFRAAWPVEATVETLD